jgi:HK97 family phage prohead protease/HK97 family phage major capsid protein
MDLRVKQSAAPPPGTDPLEYVMSDGSVDRMGDVLEPEGWQLDHFRSNPIALFGHKGDFPIGKWRDVGVRDGRLTGRLELMEAVSERLREVHAAVKAGVLRAVSVGFHPLEVEPLKDSKSGGYRFLKSELVECSLVSVPANPNALAVAKSLGLSRDTQRLIFGEQAKEDPAIRRAIATSGEHAAELPRKYKSMNISQKIQDAQSRLTTARDALTAYLNDDEQDPVTRDAMSDDIVAVEAELRSLENAERALAPRGPVQQVAATSLPAPAISRRPFGIPAKERKPGELYARAAAVHLTSYVRRQSIEDVLRERYHDDEATAVFTKAAIAGATTTTAGWAAELIETENTAFLSNLDPNAIFPRLVGLGTGLAFGPGAGNIKIPSRATTPSISGSFVAESQPIPVRRLGLTSITLVPHKVGVISVFSREIAMYSNPQIEGIIREGINDDTAITLDTLLLDAVAGSATRPAGLTAGVAALTATAGGGHAAIVGDIKKLTAPFYSVNAGRRLVFIVNPAEALSLMMTPGPDGTFGWANQFTNRFTVLESTTVPAGHVYMVDAADFVAVNGAPEFEVSETATIHMEDTSPLNIGVVGSPATIAAPTQSMFQTAQIAIRMVMSTTWAMRRAGMISHISGVTW